MPTRRSTQSKRNKSDRKVRYAVVGLGYISQIAVLPAFAHARENSELVALISDDKTKLKKLAKKYIVADTYTYETYADCLERVEMSTPSISLSPIICIARIRRPPHELVFTFYVKSRWLRPSRIVKP